MNCKHCGDALSKSIFRKDKTLKSCPKCSEKNGVYHVFYSDPQDPQKFGVTKHRVTSTHPEGFQSYCVKCRGGNPPNPKGEKLCKDIE